MSGNGARILASRAELVDGERRLATPRPRGRARDADDVAEIEVELTGAALVAEELDPPRAVDEVEERRASPCSRRAITRPARRNFFDSSVAPASSVSASARTAAISSRSGKRFGSIAASLVGVASPEQPSNRQRSAARAGRRYAALMSRILYLREPRGADDLDGLALLLPDDRLADRRLVRELQLGRDSPRPSRRSCTRPSGSRRRPSAAPWRRSRRRSDRRRPSRSRARSRDAPRAVAILCSSIACSFLASSYSAFSEMSPNSRATRIRSATSRRLSVESVLDLLLELLVALRRENDFLHSFPS